MLRSNAIFVLLFLLLTAGCSSPARKVLLANSEGGVNDLRKKVVPEGCPAEIELKINDTLALEFIEYPGRGFSWIFSTPDTAMQFLTLVKVERWQMTDLDGSPEKVIFLFTGHSVGKQPVRFNYQRPWEKKKPPLDSCQVLVFIKKP